MAVPGLIEALRDSDGGTRSDAATSLGKLGDPRAVEGLIGALGDSDSGVRASSAEALGKLGDPRAVDGLISRSKTQTTQRVPSLSCRIPRWWTGPQ